MMTSAGKGSFYWRAIALGQSNCQDSLIKLCAILSRASVSPNLACYIYQSERLVAFAEGRQSGVGGRYRSAKLHRRAAGTTPAGETNPALSQLPCSWHSNVLKMAP